MAYNYLFDLHRYIGERLADADNKLKNNTEPALKSFQKGRTVLLQDFQEFLKDRYHHKLPLRLSQRLKKINGTYRLT
ncbi:MAG: hypothetical protein P1P89_20995 [Desulfobacterales bacterium]|nr:hypothetical protein [Desulfobacterales bacterium]